MVNRDNVIFKFTFAFKINISILISVKSIESNELKIGLYILKAKQIINFLKHADKIISILGMTNLIIKLTLIFILIDTWLNNKKVKLQQLIKRRVLWEKIKEDF